MRIALSNASASWGGVHQVTEDLARGLGARGHELLLLCRPDSALAERLGSTVPTAPVLRGMDFNPRSLWLAGRALRRFRPDVALMLMKKDVRLTAPMAGALGVPVVVRHANDSPLTGGLYHRLLYGAIPAHHVANSEATRRTILASAPWIGPERVSVIHNGIRLAEADGAAAPALGLPADALAIGFVGRFDERKGVLDMADAWPAIAAAVPSAHLVMVGRGGAEPRLRAALGDDPRVHWLGYRTDAREVMRALDLLLVPSHWEGFGMVALESLAAGTPVVATDASSLPEIVRDGVEGRLVPPRQPAELARAVIELARAPGVRERMRAAALRRARQFDLEIMIDRFEHRLARVAGAAHSDYPEKET